MSGLKQQLQAVYLGCAKAILMLGKDMDNDEEVVEDDFNDNSSVIVDDSKDS